VVERRRNFGIVFSCSWQITMILRRASQNCTTHLDELLPNGNVLGEPSRSRDGHCPGSGVQSNKRAPLWGSRVAPVSAWGCAASERSSRSVCAVSSEEAGPRFARGWEERGETLDVLQPACRHRYTRQGLRVCYGPQRLKIPLTAVAFFIVRPGLSQRSSRPAARWFASVEQPEAGADHY
jgi:hypothetical protein